MADSVSRMAALFRHRRSAMEMRSTEPHRGSCRTMSCCRCPHRPPAIEVMAAKPPGPAFRAATTRSERWRSFRLRPRGCCRRHGSSESRNRERLMKWRQALGTALMALALVPSGCGKEEKTAPTAPPGAPARTIAPAMNGGSSAAITTAELDRVSKAGKPYKLALIVKTRNNPFFDPMIRAAEAEAKSLGASLDVQSPAQESDKERQFALVQDVTAKGAQAILITPADSKGI